MLVADHLHCVMRR